MPDDRSPNSARLVAECHRARPAPILTPTSAQPGNHSRSQAASPPYRPVTASCSGAPDGAAPPLCEPVVITGAALGLPGIERVFDDENVARILDGQQFIDVVPRQVRHAMVDKHITRLVKRETGDPIFEAIDSEADVIKLAGRYGTFDVVEEFGVDADRTPRSTRAPGSRSAPASTRCATRASRSCSATTPRRSAPSCPIGGVCPTNCATTPA